LPKKRLAKLRDIAATVPEKEEIVKKCPPSWPPRERTDQRGHSSASSSSIDPDHPRLGAAQAPPIEIRATELGSIGPLSDAYGQVNVSVQIECRIDQLVNLLADVGSQPELISTSDLRVSPPT